MATPSVKMVDTTKSPKYFFLPARNISITSTVFDNPNESSIQKSNDCCGSPDGFVYPNNADVDTYITRKAK